jgi:predicted permease
MRKKTLHAFLLRLRNVYRKDRLDRELDAELSSHLELHIADNLRSGMSLDEARRDAQVKLGGLEQTKESVRDHRRFPWFEILLRDLRFGLRMLRKTPVFTAIAVITLAIGVGANTAIFSVVNAVLLRPLPFPHPSELIDISSRSTLFDFPYLGLSLPDLVDIRSSASAFSSLATYQESFREFSGEGKPERIESIEVSEDLFSILGMRPLIGRTFTVSDMQPGNRLVVLAYPFWQERFGGDPAALGKTIMLDGQPHTIIGVISPQPHLGFASESEVWVPFIPTEEQLTARDTFTCSVIARLKPGVSLAHAQSQLDTIAGRLTSTYPDAHKGWSIHATSLKQSLVSDSQAPLIVLFCAVGFVLLIACANVSNLFLSRGWARRREFAIRSAMGASRSALVRQLAVESLLVALAGGACAMLATNWTIHGLRAVLPPDIHRVHDLHVDGELAWFTLGASLLTALLSGLAPALLSTRQNLAAAVKESSSGAGVNAPGTGHNFLRQLLVVGELALAAVLLIGATLAVRSFGRLLQLNLGFRPDHLVTLKIDFPKFRFATSDQAIVFVQQILDGSRVISGVESASAGLVFPLSDEIGETTFQTEASASDPKLADLPALGNRVAPDFFQTLGIPFLAGRDFISADAKGNSPVFIVDETLARKYFGTIDVVGKRFSTRKESGHPVWGQIIGVVGKVRETVPTADAKPQIYAPFYQTRLATGVYLVVRTQPDPLLVVPAIEERIWAIDKNQPITAIETLNARIAIVDATPRSQTLLLGIFGGLGFLLALVGVYGVMSYLVSLQTREIGIRMALGATPRQILRLVVAHGMKLTFAGVLLGVVCGLLLTRFMRSLLFGISSTDFLSFFGVAVSLTLVALAACYIPARRATRVDPMIALRYE